jgi:hypothetical protein
MIFSSRPAGPGIRQSSADSILLSWEAQLSPGSLWPPESPIFDVADLTEIAHDQLRQQLREHDGHRDRLQCRQAGQRLSRNVYVCDARSSRSPRYERHVADKVATAERHGTASSGASPLRAPGTSLLAGNLVYPLARPNSPPDDSRPRSSSGPVFRDRVQPGPDKLTACRTQPAWCGFGRPCISTGNQASVSSRAQRRACLA